LDINRCQQAQDAYSFPVMSMVLDINGTVIHKINANVLLDQANKESGSFVSNMMATEQESPVAVVYERFLKEALNKSN
jgi:hypothetical protein